MIRTILSADVEQSSVFFEIATGQRRASPEVEAWVQSPEGQRVSAELRDELLQWVKSEHGVDFTAAPARAEPFRLDDYDKWTFDIERDFNGNIKRLHAKRT